MQLGMQLGAVRGNPGHQRPIKAIGALRVPTAPEVEWEQVGGCAAEANARGEEHRAAELLPRS